MRKIIDKQQNLFQTPIPNIKIDINSRDEIPQLLLGLQTIYSDTKIINEVFKKLEKLIPQNVSIKTGRPGMDLWKIFVLGVLRLNCNWDFDKVHHIANEHKTLREFLGHSVYDFDQKYALQTIKDNVSLFTAEILDEINQMVIKAGHHLLGKTDDEPLKARCDSFVVETDVHFPTDISLLFDAIRKILFIMAGTCAGANITLFRQYQHIFKKIKKQFNRIRRLKSSSAKDEKKKAEREQLIVNAHKSYIEMVEVQVARVKEVLIQERNSLNVARIIQIEYFVEHAERQIDQIRRRVINGDSIPHHEKVFSIFEEHTEWISKGKAGVAQELGLRVCILEDQYGFLLYHHVMEKKTDDKVALLMVEEAKKRFPELNGCSFDKGFYSPLNRKEISGHLAHVILPKKGKLSAKDQEIENSAEFVCARRKHAGVESAINALENHGLDRCLDHGIGGFKRYAAFAVVARNIQILGKIIQQKELKRQNRLKAAA